MIRSGSAIRFTGAELGEFLEIGLDFSGVRNEDDVGLEPRKWAEVVATNGPPFVLRAQDHAALSIKRSSAAFRAPVLHCDRLLRSRLAVCDS